MDKGGQSDLRTMVSKRQRTFSACTVCMLCATLMMLVLAGCVQQASPQWRSWGELYDEVQRRVTVIEAEAVLMRLVASPATQYQPDNGLQILFHYIRPSGHIIEVEVEHSRTGSIIVRENAAKDTGWVALTAAERQRWIANSRSLVVGPDEVLQRVFSHVPDEADALGSADILIGLDIDANTNERFQTPAVWRAHFFTDAEERVFFVNPVTGDILDDERRVEK